VSKNKMPMTQNFYEIALKMSRENNENKKAMAKLAILLEQYNQDSTYGYLFNVHSNVD
jgi:hypothetical protein